MTFRSYCPAFDGAFKIEAPPEDQVGLTWRKGKFATTLRLDLQTYKTRITDYDSTVDTRKQLAV